MSRAVTSGGMTNSATCTSASTASVHVHGIVPGRAGAGEQRADQLADGGPRLVAGAGRDPDDVAAVELDAERELGQQV